ncbi:MAG: sodium:solute symporter family transporter [Opitutaceae bacterium]
MHALAPTFTLLDYGVFGVYLLLTAAIGLWFVKGQRDLDEYFLAGRSMGSVVVSMTILAALFSGITFISGPGESYLNGPLFYLVNLGFFVATPLTTIVFLRLYYNPRFFTAYQYLEERFSGPLRTLAAASFILRVLLWLAAATYAPALALEQVTGMPLWFTILCTGVITTVYTTFGGMRAVIWTDVMQLIVLFGGMLLIMAVAIGRVPGGLAQVIELNGQSGRLDLSLSLDPTARITLWGLVIGSAFMHLVQMATDQVSVQRYLTATSLRTAQRGLWLKLWLVLPVTAVFYGTGAVLHAFYAVHGDPLAAGKIAKADQILPYFVINELPSGLPGLFIAAIYAASMSTISAGINSLTSSSLIDFHRRLWKGADLSDSAQLRLARILTFAYGVIVIALAFLVERLGTLLEATNKIISLVGGPLIGLFLLGMITARTTARGALIGWVAGFGATLWIAFGTKVSFLWWAATGTIVTCTAGYLSSLLEPPPADKQLDGLTWSRRPAREAEEPAPKA